MADTQKLDPWDYRQDMLQSGVSWQSFEDSLPTLFSWMTPAEIEFFVDMYRLDVEAQQKQKQQ